jgi:hypothetical protein
VVEVVLIVVSVFRLNGDALLDLIIEADVLLLTFKWRVET